MHNVVSSEKNSQTYGFYVCLLAELSSQGIMYSRHLFPYGGLINCCQLKTSAGNRMVIFFMGGGGGGGTAYTGRLRSKKATDCVPSQMITIKPKGANQLGTSFVFATRNTDFAQTFAH